MPRLTRKSLDFLLRATILSSLFSLVILMPSTISTSNASFTYSVGNANNSTKNLHLKQPEYTTKIAGNKTENSHQVSGDVVYTIEVNGTDLDFGESQVTNVTQEEAPKDLRSLRESNQSGINAKRTRRRPAEYMGEKKIAPNTSQSVNKTIITTPAPKESKEVKLQRPKLTLKSRKFLKEIKDKRKLRRISEVGNERNMVSAKNISTAASYNHENWVSFEPSPSVKSTINANDPAPQLSNRDNQVDFDDSEESDLEERLENASDNKPTTNQPPESTTSKTTKVPTAAKPVVLLREQSTKSSEDDRPIVSKSTTTTTTIDDGKKKAKVVSKSEVLPAKLRQKIIEQFVKGGGNPQNIVVSDATITTTSQSKKKTITTVYKIVPTGKQPSQIPNKLPAPKKIKSVVLKGDEYDFDINHDEVDQDDVNDTGGGGYKGEMQSQKGEKHRAQLYSSALGSLLGSPMKAGKLSGGQMMQMKRPRKVKKIMITRTEVPQQAFLSEGPKLMEHNFAGQHHQGHEDLGEFYQGPHASIFGLHDRPKEFSGEQKNAIMELDEMVLQDKDKNGANFNQNQHKKGGKHHQEEFQPIEKPELEVEHQNEVVENGKPMLNQMQDWPMGELSNDQQVDIITDTKDEPPVVAEKTLEGAKGKHLLNFRELSTSPKRLPKTKAATSAAITGGGGGGEENGGQGGVSDEGNQTKNANQSAEGARPGDEMTKRQPPEGASGKTRRKAEQRAQAPSGGEPAPANSSGANREQKSLGEPRRASRKTDHSKPKSSSADADSSSNNPKGQAGDNVGGKIKKGDEKLDSLEELKRAVTNAKQAHGGKNNGARGVKSESSSTSKNKAVSTSAKQARNQNANERDENLPPATKASKSNKTTSDASREPELESLQQPDKRLAPKSGVNLARLTAAKLPTPGPLPQRKPAGNKDSGNDSDSQSSAHSAKVNATATPADQQQQQSTGGKQTGKTKTHNIMMLIDFGPRTQSRVSYAADSEPPTDRAAKAATATAGPQQTTRLETAATRAKSDHRNDKWLPTVAGQSSADNNWRPVSGVPQASPAVSVQIYNNHMGPQPAQSMQREPSHDQLSAFERGSIESPFEGNSLDEDEESGASGQVTFDAVAASHRHPLKAPLPVSAHFVDLLHPSTPQYDSMRAQIPAPFQIHQQQQQQQQQHRHQNQQPLFQHALGDPILPGESASTNQMVRQVIDEIAMAPAAASSSALAVAAASGHNQVYTTTSVHDATTPAAAQQSHHQLAGLMEQPEEDDELLTSGQLVDAMVTPTVESFAAAARRHQQAAGGEQATKRRSDDVSTPAPDGGGPAPGVDVLGGKE